MVIDKKILIIDNQKGFIDATRAGLEEEGFIVEVAPDKKAAQKIIERQQFDLILLDLDLANSLQILKQANFSATETTIIITSAQETITTAHLAEAQQMGSAAFIQKPCPLNHLLSTIWRQLEQPAGVVQGDLQTLTLTSLITINCNEGKQAALKVWHKNHQAALFFEGGQIIHAELDQTQGEEAVYVALTWETGTFVLQDGQLAPTQTIDTKWTKLILEGLRRIDEATFDQEGIDLSQPEPAESLFEPAELFPEPEEPLLDWPEQFDDPLASTEPVSAASSTSLSPETLTDLETQLDQLYKELDLRCLIFTHSSGRLLHTRGELPNTQTRSLAALIAGSFSANTEIAAMLVKPGEDALQFQQSLQEGSDFSLYSAKVATNWLVAVVFEPGTYLGLARQLTLQVADTLAEIIAQAPAPDRVDYQNDVMSGMDDSFRQDVSNALGDLFG